MPGSGGMGAGQGEPDIGAPLDVGGVRLAAVGAGDGADDRQSEPAATPWEQADDLDRSTSCSSS
jgi:hypothetical protein